MALPRARMETLSPAERQVRYEYHRRKYLPAQMEAARHKVRHLEAEAVRLGLQELVERAS